MKALYVQFTLFIVLSCTGLYAQQETELTGRGVFVPRLDHTSIITPNLGQLVFDTNSNSFWYYDGSSWKEVPSADAANNVLEDLDADTRIQLEENPDEDLIRFDLGGTEQFRMDGPHLEILNSGNGVFLGEGAGEVDDLNSNNNTFIGYHAGKMTVSGYSNVAVGHESLKSNFNGFSNSAFGQMALDNNITGSSNTALGFNADVASDNLNNATAIGANAVVAKSNALILGGTGLNAVHVGIGTSSPDTTLHIIGNVKLVDGNEAAGKVLVSDSDGVGTWSLISGAADEDGDTKIQLEESPDEDIIRFDLGGTEHFVMNGPRLEILNSDSGVFIGEGAGANDDLSSNFNTFIGFNAGQMNTSGHSNVAIGYESLMSNTDGFSNSSFGQMALDNNLTGSNNTALGFNADVASDNLSNATAIGANAVVAKSNALILGGTGLNAVHVGIGTSSPDTTLHIIGNVKLVDGNEAAGKALISDSDGIGTWTFISESSDEDGDTKIQLEESPDEDIIRFDLGGTEHFVMNGPRLEILNSDSGVFIGEGAGANDDLTSNFNTFIGFNAGQMNTSGYSNVALGYESLMSNIDGHSNSSLGRYALRMNTSGVANAAFGVESLEGNLDGLGNSAFGYKALESNTSGNYNTAFGREALDISSSGDGNTAVGRDALDNNTTGSNNTALGFNADVSSNNLTNATALGANAHVDKSNALILGGTGPNAVHVGIGTSSPDTTLHIIGNVKLVDGNEAAGKVLVSDNDGIGAWSFIADVSDMDGDTKIQLEESPDEDILRFDLNGTEHFVMQGPRFEIKNSGNSVFIGEEAGMNDDLTANHNVFIGKEAGKDNLAGEHNIGIGFKALENTNLDNNIAIGYGVLQNSGLNGTESFHGENNVGIGKSSLFTNEIGWGNTALGFEALNLNEDGALNTAVGSDALHENVTGSYNTAVGVQALDGNISGEFNVAIGRLALFSNITGELNVGIGQGANTFGTDLVNAVVIGTNALVDATNKVRIGNSSMTSIGGQVAWTSFSDARIKNNIRENIPGLNFINRLRPISYTYDLDKQNQLLGIEDTSDYPEKYAIEDILFSGFLAQEVEEAAKEVSYEFSGIDSSGVLKGLRYAEFVVPLVKAVQELSEENNLLKEQLHMIMKRLESLEKGD